MTSIVSSNIRSNFQVGRKVWKWTYGYCQGKDGIVEEEVSLVDLENHNDNHEN